MSKFQQDYPSGKQPKDADTRKITNLLVTKKVDKLRYIYEEKDQEGDTVQKFNGYIDEQFSASEGKPSFGVMLFDDKIGGFVLIPIYGHIKFEKGKFIIQLIELDEKKIKDKKEEDQIESDQKDLKKLAQAKLSKIKQIRMKVNQSINSQKISVLRKDANNKKKKKLTEKDLDYEEVIDDDNEEEDVVINESDESSVDDNLDEDGKKMKKNLKDEEEKVPQQMNLNYEIEKGDEKDDEKGEDENGGDEDSSSMASIFGEELDDQHQVGAKRTFGDSGLKQNPQIDTKRQKK